MKQASEGINDLFRPYQGKAYVILYQERNIKALYKNC